MKNKILIPLAALAIVASTASYAEAYNTRQNQVRKTTDVSDDPAVKAAQKTRDEAEKALEAAKDKNDKAAIDAAQKALDDAEANLKAVRKAAEKTAHEKNKKKHNENGGAATGS